ncbi:hypothetical protein LR48_Vigan492s001300 [Vigna angularis]|uniref:Uncharacterized protein n=1 Tax=Phaseolus angularis TaxID=3914 RepID=A0A0L9TD15_PHAAN|nr:hypothetical protein LR48_Vigan492s001300 [Vigna angularis]
MVNERPLERRSIFAGTSPSFGEYEGQQLKKCKHSRHPGATETQRKMYTETGTYLDLASTSPPQPRCSAQAGEDTTQTNTNTHTKQGKLLMKAGEEMKVLEGN